jgi:hypothetical protein
MVSQRFLQILVDLFHEGGRFEDFGKGAEAHDPGLDLLDSGNFKNQLQRAVFELFIFPAWSIIPSLIPLLNGTTLSPYVAPSGRWTFPLALDLL